MNVGLHHRRVYPHLASLDHVALSCQCHNPIMQLAQRFRANRLPQAHQRFCVRYLLHPDPAEAAVHHIGPTFPFQRFVTPVAHMLQNQHAQGYFGWRLRPPQRPALLVPLALRLVYRIHQLLVFQ